MYKIVEFATKRSGEEWMIYDARDAEALPVILDWERYYADSMPTEKTISGVVNKLGARNIRFKMKS